MNFPPFASPTTTTTTHYHPLQKMRHKQARYDDVRRFLDLYAMDGSEDEEEEEEEGFFDRGKPPKVIPLSSMTLTVLSSDVHW